MHQKEPRLRVLGLATSMQSSMAVAMSREALLQSRGRIGHCGVDPQEYDAKADPIQHQQPLRKENLVYSRTEF